ncbi:hypothetical protein FACS1894190_10110 [Spirochaetia bacterium]|nr:hypothetical protein FACS1894190_10110 [Spirochaetia bacterium]
MKITKSFLIVIFALIFAPVVFGQDAAGPVTKSEFYIVQVPIEKVYAHAKGYVVEYRKNGMGTNVAYLPISWFKREVGSETPQKGEIVRLGSGNVMPYLTVYYKEGKTDHVKLYVRKDPAHSTWGRIISGGAPVDSEFDNVENLTFKF